MEGEGSRLFIKNRVGGARVVVARLPHGAGVQNQAYPVGVGNRQRNIRVNNELKPLIERLKARDEELLSFQDECGRLKSRLQNTQEAPSREQILDSLDDEEIFLRFSDKVLHALTPHEVISQYPQEMLLEHIQLPDMAGALVRGLLESWSSSQAGSSELTAVLNDMRALVAAGSNKPKMPTPQVSRPATERLPKVTVIGMKPNQMQEVQKRLGDRVNFNFVDKNRKADAIPAHQDVIVLWASFVKHAMQDQAKKAAASGGTKLIVHHGGVEKMIQEIESVLG